MPLPLPNLDDRAFADLLDEARALIPTYDPLWTNHNPSDPGITLVELFAWLAEMLLFRLNQVTDNHLRVFLKLLNGPQWSPTAGDLQEDVRLTVLRLRERYRAVTAADYEALAMEDFNAWLWEMRAQQVAGAPLTDWWRVTGLDPADPAHRPSGVPPVKRAQAVPEAYLDAGTEAARTARRPGYVGLIILPEVPEGPPDPEPQPGPAQLRALWGHLDRRRILTTRHHVVGPVYAPVGAEVLVARRPDVPAAELQRQVVDALTRHLNPFTGGPEGGGWPFGRDVYVSELYELLERLPSVDHVPDIALLSACPPGAVRCVPAPPLWHETGDLVGLELAPHHLPRARIAAGQIVTPEAFLSVRATARLAPAPAASPATARRAARESLRRFFHPLHGDRTWATTARTLTLEALRSALRALPEVEAATVDAELQVVDPSRLVQDGQGRTTGVRLEAGDLADVAATIVLTAAGG